MNQIENREAWLLAAREFEENRHEGLWERCLNACSQDRNEARARYLQEAAVLYDRFLAEGRRQGSPHPDGRAGIIAPGKRPRSSGRSLFSLLIQASPLNPLVISLPAMIASVLIMLPFMLAEDRFPFQVWNGLLLLTLVSCAGIVGYALMFALRKRFDAGFAREWGERADRVAIWATVSLMMIGAISTYLVWAW